MGYSPRGQKELDTTEYTILRVYSEKRRETGSRAAEVVVESSQQAALSVQVRPPERCNGGRGARQVRRQSGGSSVR